jgi:Icc-related predicted phosphoesterase
MPSALIIADLHSDMWADRKRDPLAGRDLSGVDLLLIAGDLSNKGHVQWRYALERLSAHIDLDKVHVGPGNHDYYGGRIDREDKLRDAAEAAGAHFMQKTELTHEGARFLFCTLWTDMALGGLTVEFNRMRAEEKMNDHRNIRVEAQGYRRMSALHSSTIHADHRAWLEGRLAAPFDGDTIVVTHHAPHPWSLRGTTGPGDLPFAYGSDLSELIGAYQPKMWVHGHTHQPADYEVGSTRVLNVSLGYPPEVDPGRPVGDPMTGLISWEAPVVGPSP